MFYRKNKFGAKKTKKSFDGIGWDSELEKNYYYYILKPRETAEEITDIKVHNSIELVPGINWKVDFSYIENGELIYDEVKGFETADYRLKKKLWTLFGPAKLNIIKGSGLRFHTVQTVKKGRHKVVIDV